MSIQWSKMVKTGSERSDKYGQKYDAEVVRSRYTATAESAKAKQVTQQETMAQLAAYVRTALNTAGITPLYSVVYISFANKLQGVKNKFGTGAYLTTPHKVAMVAYNQWKAENADADILADIFTHVIGSAPSPL